MEQSDEQKAAQAFNDRLANRVLTALQSAMNDGDLGEAKMILASLTIVEVMDENGCSRLALIMSDHRLTLNLGLVDYAQICLGRMS